MLNLVFDPSEAFNDRRLFTSGIFFHGHDLPLASLRILLTGVTKAAAEFPTFEPTAETPFESCIIQEKCGT